MFNYKFVLLKLIKIINSFTMKKILFLVLVLQSVTCFSQNFQTGYAIPYNKFYDFKGVTFGVVIMLTGYDKIKFM